jgi:hypothetical protein
MQLTIARISFGLILAAALLLSAVPLAQADGSCTMASAAGSWGFTDNGTVLGIGPRTAVGIFTLDRHGNLTNGVATSSLNGMVAAETFSGTYTINPDCTGTVSVKIYSGSTELFSVTLSTVFDDNMTELRGLFTSIVTPTGVSLPNVIGLQAKKVKSAQND